MKILPAYDHGYPPDDECADAIQDHAVGRAHLFRDRDTKEVEAGDAAHIAKKSNQDDRAIANLG